MLLEHWPMSLPAKYSEHIFQSYMGTATYNNKQKRPISGNIHLYPPKRPDIYRTTQRFKHNLEMSLITISGTSSLDSA